VQRAFARISLVWGVYLLARSALRLVVLLNFSIDVYVAVNVITAGPITIVLTAWSFWYGLRAIRLAVAEPYM
jgi:intracellular septation protein A